MVPWSFLSISLNDCAVCIIDNEGLIRKIYLPKLVFPLARVLISLVTFVLLAGCDVPAAVAAGGPAVAVDAVLAGGDRAVRGLHARPEPDRGHGQHVLSRLRPPGLGVLAGLVFRHADPLSDRRQFPGKHAVAVPAQSGVLFHRAVSRRLVRGAMASVRPGGGGRRDRGGEPGSRLCHIQVPRRQDGLPTLIGAERAERKPAAPAPLIELNDVSLRFVNYADKQYSLKRAALDLVLRREAPGRRRSSGRCATSTSRSSRASASGIVGGNGAGKSTLLRLLARIYPPTSGQVADPRQRRPLDRDGGGLQPRALRDRQHPVQRRHARLSAGARCSARSDGIYEFTGLREFAELPLKYYSSGMYMRLAFAIATEVDPDILLIDESLGVGDAAFLDKAKARIRNLLDRSKAVVLVSHDLESLREFCTRGLWIQHGRLVADGPIDEVIDRYLESNSAAAASA